MSNQFLKLRRSSVPGKVPTTSSLEFGEIALNTYDGLAFIKKSGSNGEEIISIGSTSGSFTGSLFGTASWAINAETSSYSLNIDGQQYYVAVFDSQNSLSSSTIYQSASFIGFPNATQPYDPNNPDLLFISGSGVDTFNLISAHADRDGYVQINVQNFSQANNASSDIVASANNATENSYYIDMGINGENYANNALVGFANDAYIYSTGNDLLIGNASTGRRVVIFNGGLEAEANAKIFIHEQGTVGINTNLYNPVNPPSLFVKAPNSTTFNVIQGQADTDGFTEISHANVNAGNSASADFVAYNDIDPTNQSSGYVDMGINSTTYVPSVDYPGTAGDAYVYTDSHHLIIGTISQSAEARVTIFAGGVNELDNSKLVLYGSNQHQMTGSLNASQGFTGSLFGTASWALNSLTASYAVSVSGTIANAVSSSYAATASWAVNAITASYVLNAVSSSFASTASFVTTAQTASFIATASWANNAVTASFVTLAQTASYVQQAQTASYVLQAVSSSFASTASYVQNAVSAAFATNAATASSADNFVVRGDVTGSNALFTGTITAQRLNVQYVTASTEYITGSSKFGSQLTDTHQFTGSVSITGSLTVNGPLNATSSWASNALTASYVPSTGIIGDFSRIATGSVTASVGIGTASFQIVSGSSNLLFVSNSGVLYVSSAISIGSTTTELVSGRTTLIRFNGIGSGYNAFIQGTAGELQFWHGNSGTHIRLLSSNRTQFDQQSTFSNSITVQPGANSATLGFNANLGTGASAYPSATIATFTSGSVTVLGISGSGIYGTGSFNWLGSISAPSFTGSLFGTASWALNALTASFVPSTAIVGDVSRIATGSVTASVDVGAASFQLVSGSSTFLFVNNNGRVGVGTSNPSASLDVSGSLVVNTPNSSYDLVVTGSVSGSIVRIGTDQQAVQGNLHVPKLYVKPNYAQNRAGIHVASNTSGTVPRAIYSGYGAESEGILNAIKIQYLQTSNANDQNGNYFTMATDSRYGFFAFNSIADSGNTNSGSNGFASNLYFQNLGASLTSSGAHQGYKSVVQFATSPVLVASVSDFLADTLRVPANGTLTNRYGFHITFTSESITNPWGVYQVSNTVNNHFNGGVYIGTTTTSSLKLDVSGSARITNGLVVTGSSTINNLTGSLFGTASWALNTLTSSYVLNAVSASFASTASFVTTAQTASFVATSSWAQNAITASYILNAVSSSFSSTASFVTTAQTASFVATASWATNAVTASYVLNAVSSSFATTASFVTTAQTASFVATSSWATNAVTASYVTGSIFTSTNPALSASYALSASFAQNAATASYVLASGVVGLSLNQITSGSVTASVNINSASFQLVSASTQLLFVSNSGLITAQRLSLSSSRDMASGSTLTVYGSGSAQPVFTVQGSQGELFSVTDSLSGSLFSVNDISGLPIIEAFSDNRVLIGSYQAPMLTTTVRTTLAVGNNIVFQNVPTASYDAVFFEYSLKSGSNSRAGSMMGVWSGSEANFTEVVTMDYGNTSGVKLMVMVTGSNVALTGSATTANWTMKTIVRAI